MRCERPAGKSFYLVNHWLSNRLRYKNPTGDAIIALRTLSEHLEIRGLMMKEIRVPDMGRSTKTATLIEFLKKEGDSVAEGESVFCLEADKAEFEIESPVSGTLRKLLVELDGSVCSGTVVALVGEADEELPDLSLYGAQTVGADGGDSGDMNDVSGTTRVPLTELRKIITKRMVASKTSAPHYYLTIEVDMTSAIELKRSITEFKVSQNDILMCAVARAIEKHPQMNSRWAGDAIEEVDDINLGFALALPKGLVVPVVKRAQDRSLEDIGSECKRLAGLARDRKLMPGEFSGNTFTVSNLGPLGIDEFSAIINPPDCAILAVGRTKDRAVVEKGEVVVRPIAKLTLSCDHRVIDGADSARFLNYLRRVLEKAKF